MLANIPARRASEWIVRRHAAQPDDPLASDVLAVVDEATSPLANTSFETRSLVHYGSTRLRVELVYMVQNPRAAQEFVFGSPRSSFTTSEPDSKGE